MKRRGIQQARKTVLQPNVTMKFLVCLPLALSVLYQVSALEGECSEAGKKASETSCCGELYKYDYTAFVRYYYTPSDFEMSGACCRSDLTYQNSKFYLVGDGSYLEENSPGGCMCDDTASDCHTTDPCTINRTLADNSECCGKLYKYSYSTTNIQAFYLASAQENAGTCCREANTLPFNEMADYPVNLPGSCYCDSSEYTCFDPTTTPEPTTTTPEPTTTTPEPTTTTPEPTTTTPEPTTTTPEPTTTTPEPTTTTPEPTTTTPEPTTTTPEPTTTTPEPTTTTPEPTTTTPQPTTTPGPVCPERPTFSARVLGGTDVDECTIDGVLALGTELQQICNGVYVYNPSSTPGVPGIYVSTDCKTTLDELAANEMAIAMLGNETGTYNAITFDPQSDVLFEEVVDNTNDAITYLLPTPGLLDTGSCQEPACVYDPDTMSSNIDFDDCYLTSYGSDGLTATGPTTTGTLQMVALQKGTNTDCTKSTSGSEAECFTPVGDGISTCSGDTGAPVYCAMNTGETVLYGLLDSVSTCGTETSFAVLPVAVV